MGEAFHGSIVAYWRIIRNGGETRIIVFHHEETEGHEE